VHNILIILVSKVLANGAGRLLANTSANTLANTFRRRDADAPGGYNGLMASASIRP
jgi:hypothetical protein